MRCQLVHSVKTHRRPQILSLSALLGAAFFAGSLWAQTTQTSTPVDGSTPPAIAGGQPAGSYALSGFETVNLFNGNLDFRLPLVSMKGRGRSAVHIELPIQRRWAMQNIVALSTYSPAYGAVDIDDPPYQESISQPYGAGTLSVREIGNQIFSSCQNGNSAMYQSTLTRFTFTEPDGTEHDFVDALTGGQPQLTQPAPGGDPSGPLYTCYPLAFQSRGRVWISRDGTFSTLILDSDVTDGTAFSGGPPQPSFTTLSSGRAGYMYQKDGTVYRINADGNVDWIRDPNGNKVSYTYGTNKDDPITYLKVLQITDSLGRAVNITYAPAYSSLPSTGQVDPYDTISYPGIGGTPRIIKIHYCLLDPGASNQSCPNYTPTASQSYFSLFGLQSSTSQFDPLVVSSVELPDSRRYQMSYNAYGELTKVSLPTGGSFQYSWGPGDPSQSTTQAGIIGYATAGASPQIYRRVLQRSVYLSGSQLESTTSYNAWYTKNCSPAVPASGVTFCTTVGETVADASGTILSATRHWFYGGANDPLTYYSDANWYPKWTEGREYLTEELNVTGGSFDVTKASAIRTETQHWAQRPCLAVENCPAQTGTTPLYYSPVDVRSGETDTAWLEVGSVSKEIYSSFDQFNNILEQDDYGFDGNLYRKHVNSYFPSRSIGGVSYDYWNIPTVNGKYGTFSGNYASIVHIRNLPSEQQIFDASGNEAARTTFDYDGASLGSEGNLVQWDSTVPAARGNLTKKSAWLLGSGSAPLDTNYQYDLAGNVTSVKDPRGNTTSVVYSDAYANAFPTEVIFPLGASFNVQTAYDFSTGKPTSFTDMNSNMTGYQYADELDRLTEADLPDGGVTTFAYCDAGSNQACTSSSSPNSVTKTVKQNSCQTGNKIVSDALYDGLGRTTKTHLYEDSGSIVVQTLFDGMGRPYKVSNPERSETPVNFTTTLYDSLGRVQTVTSPDGSPSTSYWVGTHVTMTDPFGAARYLLQDAFGRLTKVTEDPAGSPSDTNYIYSVLDDLTGVCQNGTFTSTGVCQNGRQRSFSYDSLKRLTAATNPESGTISYGYDASGNVVTRQDARGHITCYGTFSGSSCSDGYDAINRLQNKSYQLGSATDGVAAPAVTYIWDTVSKGHLSTVSSSASLTSYLGYDPMGRVTSSSQVTNGQTYHFNYTYNLAGNLESEQYPSQRTVQTCYDSAGRESGVSGTPANAPSSVTNYASAVTYAPHGDMQSANLGNTLSEAWSYNNRLQPVSIGVGTPGNTQSGFGVNLYYCPMKAASCITNNCNLQTATETILGVDQNFTYDKRNRVLTAAESGTSWSQAYSYDVYGNRWVTAGAADPFTPVASTNFDANNRLQIQGSTYDLAGNLTQIGGYLSVWDSEERTVSSSINNMTTSYSYDGDGKRVFKQAPGGTTAYVYDAAGKLAAEYSTGAVSTACSTCYLSTDHLGSVRLITDQNGLAVTRQDYLPFGEQVSSAYGGRNNAALLFDVSTDVNQKFTGKERDSESGLDYFGARYFGSALGRFTSPDPLMASAHPENPQSWNRYSYALNNPLSVGDIDGLYPSPAFTCDKDHSACLNDDQRRILNNSSVKIGDKTLSGEALWNAIGGQTNGEALQNSFVNQTDGLSAVKFADGKSAISFVSSITGVNQDRIFASVGAGLADELSNDSRFGTVSASLHADGGYGALSYKSNDYPQGNIQFSFNASHTGADIDHDLYMPGLAHLFGEVLANHVTGGLTNQDSVRQMLMKNPKIGLTPSPDPKWNRK
jgi:RHS repeat-associated protein